ncbi:MAG TPA: thiamine diphosphokinase [Paracoccaceae bacterium]|nr:thiamine diphosphokinase [Paracoccaceae bacterium]
MQGGEALPLVFRRPVTLVGAGVLTRDMLDEALALAPELVAADGGADRLAGWGLAPAAVIGDMDSVADPERWRGSSRVLQLPEQDTTDFEKCLYATEAPFYIGAGFTGARVDHMLAVLHAMLARPGKPVVLLGEADAIALLPPGRVIGVDLAPGARVSLFPLAPVRGTHSAGLTWPVEGLEMAPGVRIGTSNIATGGRVELGFDAPGAVMIVERRHLAALIGALV